MLPVRVARSLLERLLPASQRDAVLGDLEEEYVSIQRTLGSRHADAMYCREAIVALAFAASHLILSIFRRDFQRRDLVIERSERAMTTRVLMNVVAFAAFWLIGRALIQFAERSLHGWPSSELMQFAACALGAVIALRLRAGLVALFLAGQFAFTGSELLMHSFFGIRSVQGGPTHFAVMIAAVGGVGLGVFITPYVMRNAPRPPAIPIESDAISRAAGSPSEVVLTA